MCAYSTVNGVYACQNPYLLNTALYAKVDHVALGTVARPWPAGAQ